MMTEWVGISILRKLRSMHHTSMNQSKELGYSQYSKGLEWISLGCSGFEVWRIKLPAFYLLNVVNLTLDCLKSSLPCFG